MVATQAGTVHAGDETEALDKPVALVDIVGVLADKTVTGLTLPVVAAALVVMVTGVEDLGGLAMAA